MGKYTFKLEKEGNDATLYCRVEFEYKGEQKEIITSQEIEDFEEKDLKMHQKNLSIIVNSEISKFKIEN